MKIRIEKNGGTCFIPLPEVVAKDFIDKGHKRVICNVDDRFEFHCAILRSKAIGYYIMWVKRF